MIRDAVHAGQIGQINNAIICLVEFLESSLYDSTSAGIQVATKTHEELVVIKRTVVVLVEELENTLKLRGSEHVPVLLESPGELLTVKSAVVAVVHSAENAAKSTDTVCPSLLQDNENFVKHLIGRLSGNAKHWVNIRAVAATSSCESCSELLIVKFSIAI
jgi:hypothetical protein